MFMQCHVHNRWQPGATAALIITPVIKNCHAQCGCIHIDISTSMSPEARLAT